VTDSGRGADDEELRGREGEVKRCSDDSQGEFEAEVFVRFEAAEICVAERFFGMWLRSWVTFRVVI
jgi:hypothetical protein